MNTYILSQIFVIISYIFLISTYQVKKDKNMILILNVIACSFSAIAFSLLKAYAGCAMSVIAVMRNILFANKRINKNDGLLIISSLIIILSIYTFENIYSLLPAVATLLYTISVWQDSNIIYRVFGIPIEICWLTYHICIQSIFGIALELILFISVVVSIIRKD